MAEVDDWQPVTKPADDWQPVTRQEPENPAVPPSFLQRFASNTAEFFKGGFESTIDAPGQIAGLKGPTGFDDFAPNIEQKMLEIGASPERAKAESKLLTQRLARGQGLASIIGGPIQMLFSPVFGAFRTGISEPIEQATGFPKEMSETLVMSALAVAGLRGTTPQIARVKVNENGGVSAQMVGELPKAGDFTTGAEILGGKPTEANLKRAWAEDGIHPAEAVNDAKGDAFAKRDLTTEPKPYKLAAADEEVLTETGGKPHDLSAAAGEPPADVPLSRQPPPLPGRLMTAAHEAGQKLLDIGRDAQMLVAPMARGTVDSMAIAKDFANTLRRNRWEWSRVDNDVATRFNPEQRARMWNAADEESVALQRGEPREHQGLITLEPEERAAVQQLQERAQTAWVRARDLGMVEGDGLPSYTPRMVMNVAIGTDRGGPIPLNGLGLNLRTRTGQMSRRMYLTAEETEAAAKRLVGQRAAEKLKSLDEIHAAIDDVRIARDIRALPLATARLEDAIAGRTLINNIKEYGGRTGTETVVEGGIPAGAEAKYFTLDHPSFRTWKPRIEKKEGGGVEVVRDAEGNTIFDQVPIYVHGDFEGPLKAVLTQRNGPVYGAMMSLKAKTMSLIMNSPMIHNAVEWGRAVPAMPGKVATFKVYFEGNRVKNDPLQMREAIDAGLVPIGKRFFNQDITSIMEAPDLTPGRSWTAKVLGFVPGLFDEGAGVAVKRAIDKAGDFWHNTLLWDRIADLQAGLYSNFRDEMIAKGIDKGTATKVAAHWANRYAGALPQEAMSDAARKVANVFLFSRSFTMGNLGVLKDMFTGLPKDVLAQLERDGGFGKGAIANAEAPVPGAAEAVSYAKSLARRKAMAVIALDVGMMYVGNSLLQSAINVIRTDRTVPEELKTYSDRFAAAMENVKEHPLSLLQPFDFLQRLSSTYENEPGKQDRVRIGTAKDGTAIYVRNPVGKIGEEFVGYMSGPLDMMRRKLGTIARPGWQILSNDKGFGRKVYDPNADTPAKYALNLGRIAAHLTASQLPEGQMSAAMDLVKGDGDANVNTAQVLGPFAGLTFAKGAPGGPAIGELYHAREIHNFNVDRELPDIRKQVQRGDIAGAQERLTALGVPPGLQRFYIRTSLFPETRLNGRTLRDFYQYATPEQRQRMERARE